MDIELNPILLEGTIIEVYELGVTIKLNGRMGVVNLPLRSVFTDKKLEVDNKVQIYMSYAKVL